MRVPLFVGRKTELCVRVEEAGGFTDIKSVRKMPRPGPPYSTFQCSASHSSSATGAQAWAAATHLSLYSLGLSWFR